MIENRLEHRPATASPTSKTASLGKHGRIELTTAAASHASGAARDVYAPLINLKLVISELLLEGVTFPRNRILQLLRLWIARSLRFDVILVAGTFTHSRELLATN